MIIAMLAAAVSVSPMRQLQPIIAEASVQTRLPVTWISSVIAAESGGRTNGPRGRLRSPAGAMGVMQIMPRTWLDMVGHDATRFDPDRARDNILIGSAYLLRLYQRFGLPGAIAAYHAGPANYEAFLRGRATLPGATQRYVRIVLGRRRVRNDGGEKPKSSISPPGIWAIGPVNDAPSVSPAFPGLFIPLGYNIDQDRHADESSK